MSREYDCGDVARIIRASKRKLEQKENTWRNENPRIMTVPPGFYNQSKKSQISYVESKLNKKLTRWV